MSFCLSWVAVSVVAHPIQTRLVCHGGDAITILPTIMKAFSVWLLFLLSLGSFSCAVLQDEEVEEEMKKEVEGSVVQDIPNINNNQTTAVVNSSLPGSSTIVSTAPTLSPTTEVSNLPKLPFGDINILVLTDTHSWVGGHAGKEKKAMQPDADYGHVLSFYQQLVASIKDTKDLFFVVNGDWIDGTGLSMNGEVYALTQILQHMPWDAVNVGNHELYHPEAVAAIRQPAGFIEWWGDGYLTSNIVDATSREPLGHRFKVLRGKHVTVLTFGFLYNMRDHVATVDVEVVQNVVKEGWFRDALHVEKYDGILVLAHMHVTDDLVSVIREAIRDELGQDMPIQFITGHTHIRDYVVLDNASTSFEAGRFLDTLGFVSFPTQGRIQQKDSSTATSNQQFQHVFINATVEQFRETLQVEDLITPEGERLSKFIKRVEAAKGLKEVLGCLDSSYYLEKNASDPQSLWGYFDRAVMASQFNRDQVSLFGYGQWRYDLVRGLDDEVLLGDAISVSPFNDSLVAWKNIPGSLILSAKDLLNGYILSTGLAGLHDKPDLHYDLIGSEWGSSRIQDALTRAGWSNSSGSAVRLHVTDTSIWIDHLRGHSPCTKKHGYIKNNKNKDKHPPIGSKHKGSSSSSFTPIISDELYLVIIAGCMVIVILTSAVYVRQLGARHLEATARVQQATDEAWQEYYGDLDNSSIVVDEDEEEDNPVNTSVSEGLFV